MDFLFTNLCKLFRDLPPSRKHLGPDHVVRTAVLQLEYDSSFKNRKIFTDFFTSLLSKIASFSPDVVVFPALTDLFFVRGVWSFPLPGRFIKNRLKVPETVSKQCERFMLELSRRLNCTVAFGTTRGLKLCSGGRSLGEKRTKVKDYVLALVPKRLLASSEALAKLVEEGVRIVVTPTSGTNIYSEWDDKYYFWSHAQMVGYYCLKATLVGKLLQNRLKDRACVCGPIPITQNHDGYIVRNESLEGNAVLLAELDMERLEKFLLEQKSKFSTIMF